MLGAGALPLCPRTHIELLSFQQNSSTHIFMFSFNNEVLRPIYIQKSKNATTFFSARTHCLHYLTKWCKIVQKKYVKRDASKVCSVTLSVFCRALKYVTLVPGSANRGAKDFFYLTVKKTQSQNKK